MTQIKITSLKIRYRKYLEMKSSREKDYCLQLFLVNLSEILPLINI